MKIAVISDGLEATRQFHADQGRAIREAVAGLQIGRESLEVEIMSGQRAVDTLRTLPNAEFAALIFASNSLRHPDSQIALALHESAAAVTEFLARGHGIAVLHQYISGPIGIELPNGSRPKLEPLGAGNLRPLSRMEPSQILQYPRSIPDLETEFTVDNGQLGRVTSWRRIDPGSCEGLEPVFSGENGDILMMQATEHSEWRFLLSAVPLDWHGALKVLQNCIFYLCAGKPRAVIWTSDEGRHQDIELPLAYLPTTVFSGLSESVGENRRWLAQQDIAHIIPDIEHAAHMSAQGHGGLLISLDEREDAGGSVARVVVDVPFSGQRFADKFFTRVAAEGISLPGVLDPYPRRNLVVASHYFRTRYPESWQRAGAESFAEETLSSDDFVFEGMTITSALAAAQTILTLPEHRNTTRLRKRVRDVIASLVPETQRNCEVQLALWCLGSSGRSSIARNELRQLSAHDLSAAEAIRTLDWLGFISFVLNQGHQIEHLGPLVQTLLEQAALTSSAGVWLSTEGSANAVLGAMSILTVESNSARYSLISDAVAHLREIAERPGCNVAPIELMARVWMALAVVEMRKPLVLDRLADTIPRAIDMNTRMHGRPNSQQQDEARSVAERNVQLRNRIEALELQLRESRPMYRLGVGTAWTLTVIVTGALCLATWHLISGLPGAWAFLATPVALVPLWCFVGLTKFLKRWAAIPRPLEKLLGWWDKISPLSRPGP